MNLIEGEKEIITGVTVFPSPGHTQGGQSVEVEADAEKIIVARLYPQPATFELSEEMKKRKCAASAPLIHQDVREAYDSILEIKNRRGQIVALHDPAYKKKDSSP